MKSLGQVPYLSTWYAMRDFTLNRDQTTADEIWLCSHPSVYTVGRQSKAIQPTLNSIPIIQTDRGGLITYHGPGQLVIYPLIDLRCRRLGPKKFVCLLEEALILVLEKWGLTAERRPKAPGIYVHGMKIASLGLRIKYSKSYHGIALNVAMDLRPFKAITPCGLDGIQMTDIRSLTGEIPSLDTIGEQFVAHLKNFLDKESK